MTALALYSLMRTVLVAWLVLEVTRSIRSRRRTASSERDSGSGPVIFIGAFVGMSLAGNAARLHVLALPGGRIDYVAAGFVVMAAGMALRAWAFATLGNLFTYRVTIQDEHHLVDSGPYRYMRHPSYTGLALIFVGYALALASGLSLLVLIAALAPVLAYRIRVEERALTTALGDEYRDYSKKTKRLIPGVI